MAEATLTPYREEIARLYVTRRESQAEIIRHLERVHGVRVSKATLSRFLKTLPAAQHPPAPDGPQLSPDEEELLAKVEILEGVRVRLDELIDLVTRTHARLEVLEDAAAERHAALLRQMKPDPPPDGGTVSHAVLVGIWKRAGLVTGMVWGVLTLLGVLAWLWWSRPATTPPVTTPARLEAPVKKR